MPHVFKNYDALLGFLDKRIEDYEAMFDKPKLLAMGDNTRIRMRLAELRSLRAVLGESVFNEPLPESRLSDRLT